MAYAWLSDTFFCDPKIAVAGPIAAHLLIAAVSWSNQHLTDGHVPRDVVPQLLDLSQILPQLGIKDRKPKATALEFAAICVKTELFTEAEDGGYIIVNFHRYSRHASEVRASRVTRDRLREIRAEAGRKGADARWQNGKSAINGLMSTPSASHEHSVSVSREPHETTIHAQTDGKPDSKPMAADPYRSIDLLTSNCLPRAGAREAINADELFGAEKTADDKPSLPPLNTLQELGFQLEEGDYEWAQTELSPAPTRQWVDNATADWLDYRSSPTARDERDTPSGWDRRWRADLRRKMASNWGRAKPGRPSIDEQPRHTLLELRT